MNNCILAFLFWASFLGLYISLLEANESKPNVIFILTDDLGYGEIEGRFSIRQGYWKLLLQKLGPEKEQLYHLKEDLGETTNLANKHPEKVKELLALLNDQVADGRSTPGAPQKNDAPIDLWKSSGK